MLSKITIKSRVPVYFFLISLILFTLFLSLMPARTFAVAPQKSFDRRNVAGFRQCLYRLNFYIAYGDKDHEFKEFDKWLDSELAVVGLDMETGNGVNTCRQVLIETSKLIGNTQNESEALLWFQRQITKDGKIFDEQSYHKVKGKDMEQPIKNLIDGKLDPFVANIAVTNSELAERMLIAADFCYGYSNSKFDPTEFLAIGKAGTIYATKLDIPAEKAALFVKLDKNNGINPTLGNAGNTAKLGNLSLGFQLKSGLFNSTPTGKWEDAYSNDFLPFGADDGDFYSEQIIGNGGEGDGTIRDCRMVMDLKDKIFPFYELNSDLKLTLDGVTALEYRTAGTSDSTIGFAGADDNPNCESKGGNLSWILCPIINGALDLTDWIFNKFIGPYLFISPLTTNAEDPVYIIWKSFRTIGNILLIFGLLFIVFGQAIGGGLVDAYTAKKAMPRILVAAIAINLSYFLVAITVDIFNVLGTGIGQLITSPLNNAGSFNFTVGESYGSAGTFITGGILGLALGATFLVTLVQQVGGGQVIILFLTFIMIPIVILVISIFGTLIIRRGLIIFLAVVSPVAMALFILPNTEKYAKKWFDLLIKALVVYPIIVAIFAIADVLSVLIMGSGAEDALLGDVTTQLVGLVVIFMPLFLIPFSFKLAGGFIGTVSGSIKGFGDKRREKYLGNELDEHSRANKYKGMIKSGKENAAGKRQTFLETQARKKSSSDSNSRFSRQAKWYVARSGRRRGHKDRSPITGSPGTELPESSIIPDLAGGAVPTTPKFSFEVPPLVRPRGDSTGGGRQTRISSDGLNGGGPAGGFIPSPSSPSPDPSTGGGRQTRISSDGLNGGGPAGGFIPSPSSPSPDPSTGGGSVVTPKPSTSYIPKADSTTTPTTAPDPANRQDRYRDIGNAVKEAREAARGAREATSESQAETAQTSKVRENSIRTQDLNKRATEQDIETINNDLKNWRNKP